MLRYLYMIFLVMNFNNVEGNNFRILGWTINFTRLQFNAVQCDYFTTCPKLVCDTLNNKTLSDMGLSFVILEHYSTKTLSSLKCELLPSTFDSSIITFIINLGEIFRTPFSCNTIGNCFNKACVLFNQEKLNLAIGFTGQCKFSPI